MNIATGEENEKLSKYENEMDNYYSRSDSSLTNLYMKKPELLWDSGLNTNGTITLNKNYDEYNMLVFIGKREDAYTTNIILKDSFEQINFIGVASTSNVNYYIYRTAQCINKNQVILNISNSGFSDGSIVKIYGIN